MILIGCHLYFSFTWQLNFWIKKVNLLLFFLKILKSLTAITYSNFLYVSASTSCACHLQLQMLPCSSVSIATWILVQSECSLRQNFPNIIFSLFIPWRALTNAKRHFFRKWCAVWSTSARNRLWSLVVLCCLVRALRSVLSIFHALPF